MSQLTNYIQKELDKGFSKDLITKKLLQAGYTQQEIGESFKSLKSAEPLLRRKFADTLHLETHIQWSKWIFGLLAIIVVIILGFLMYQYKGELSSYQEQDVSSCDSLSDREKDICYLQLSATGEDYCSAIQNMAIKTACDERVWETNNCTYELFIGNDYDKCLYQKAVETKDTKYCTMQEEHSDCLLQLALDAGDNSLCEGDGYCLFNYATEKKDITVCESLAGMFQYQCYDAYAAETGDFSVCDKGSFICGYPSNGTAEEKKAFIEEKISPLSTEATEEGALSDRDKKLLFAAFHTRDSLFCSFVLDLEEKEQCIGELQ